jgi:uncharacterized protein YecE (DUF72 family)
MREIHIGTSGWSYKDWKETFYPPKLKPTDYLSFYSEHFSCTEINSSFYHLTRASTIESWLEKVPKSFKFCPKISRYLSHSKQLHDSKEPLKVFFGIYELMKKQMGPVLIQLPASVKFIEEVVFDFYQNLRQDYSDYDFAIEVRDESWFSDRSLRLMQEYCIILVIAQSSKFPYLEAFTAENIYIRFHGPESLYGSSYSDEALKEYSKKMIAWKKAGHAVWAFFNNDINGHAIANAKRLQEFVNLDI